MPSVDPRDFFDNKQEYITRIATELDKHLWDLIENKNPDVYVDKIVLYDLKKLCFGVNKIQENSLVRLSNLGIIYEGKVLPDDLKNRLVERWRKDIISNFDSYSVETRTSKFVKLILLIGYIEKETIKNYEDLINCSIASKEILNNLIDYLESSKIITRNRNDSINLDKHILKLWRNDERRILKEFYDFYFRRNDLKANLLFEALLLLQRDDMEWIHLSESDFILGKFEDEINALKLEGCIYSIKYNNSEYIQLSPEIWFLLNGDIPHAWNVKNIILTPDFELFIPYYFNPFVIYTINYYGEMLNRIITRSKKRRINIKNRKKDNKEKLEKFSKGYDDDYYLVYNIKDINKKMSVEIYNNKFLNIFQSIMPDIVKDELSTKKF